jgi:hypothetical protein
MKFLLLKATVQVTQHFAREIYPVGCSKIEGNYTSRVATLDSIVRDVVLGAATLLVP